MIVDVQGFDRSPWVSTAYLLTSTAADRIDVSQMCEDVCAVSQLLVGSVEVGYNEAQRYK